MAKRIDIRNCFGLVIDVQDHFLAALKNEQRQHIERGTSQFCLLLKYLQIPILLTIERPIASKGSLANAIAMAIKGFTGATTMEKDFFDLTKHPQIVAHLSAMSKTQAIVAGCETDVCVLQSCLGLLDRGYDVFLVGDLLFSSTSDVNSSLARLRTAGATIVTCKTFFHEVFEAAEGSPHRKEMEERLGAVPDGLPDFL